MIYVSLLIIILTITIILASLKIISSKLGNKELSLKYIKENNKKNPYKRPNLLDFGLSVLVFVLITVLIPQKLILIRILLMLIYILILTKNTRKQIKIRASYILKDSNFENKYYYWLITTINIALILVPLEFYAFLLLIW